MAIALTKKELENEKVVSYKDIRDQLHTGQLVFCSGKYLFSGIIQRLTKSVWSHVAIIYRDEKLGRVLILEAEPFVGIRLIPLSKYLNDYKDNQKPYKGLMFIADVEPKPSERELNKAISFGLDELARPYDNWEIFRILLRILFRWGKKEKNRNYICSELVHDAFRRANIHFPETDTYTSPDGIWNNDMVKKLWRVL
jgi:hypothetical protein